MHGTAVWLSGWLAGCRAVWLFGCLAGGWEEDGMVVVAKDDGEEKEKGALCFEEPANQLN